jgi:hypothetical protein
MLLNKNYLENYFKGKSKEEGINYLVLSVSIMTAMGQCGHNLRLSGSFFKKKERRRKTE